MLDSAKDDLKHTPNKPPFPRSAFELCIVLQLKVFAVLHALTLLAKPTIHVHPPDCMLFVGQASILAGKGMLARPATHMMQHMLSQSNHILVHYLLQMLSRKRLQKPQQLQSQKGKQHLPVSQDHRRHLLKHLQLRMVLQLPQLLRLLSR